MNRNASSRFLSVLAFSAILGTVHAIASPPTSTTDQADTWDLTHIYPSDTAWDGARLEFVAQIDRISELAPDWPSSASQMLAYFELDCELARSFFRLISYADLNTSTNMDSAAYRQMTSQMLQHFSRWQTIISDTDSRLLALGQEAFDQYLSAEPALARFGFEIEDVFASSRNALAPEQERLVAGTDSFGYASLMAYRALAGSEMPRPTVTLSDGSVHQLDYPTFASLLDVENRDDRNLAVETYHSAFGAFEHTFAALIDGEVKRRHYNATARGHSDSLSARLASDHIDPVIFTTTIDTMRANRGSLQEYLRIKARLASIRTASNAASYSFDEASHLILSSLEFLGEPYLEPLRTAFNGGWTDRYPRPGKKGFGGTTPVPGAHPYVLLNFTGSLSDVYVATHELGHAIHFWLMDSSNPCTAHSSSGITDEIAALFNEHILSDALFATSSDPWHKLQILERSLDRMAAAIFDQARLAEFEAEIHRQVAEGRSLSADWLNRRYFELLREYRQAEADGSPLIEARKYGWMDIEALYMNHYVINYTWGSIAALALVEMVKTEGTEGSARYLEYLRNGGNDAPMALLKNAGVNMGESTPYETAISVFDLRVQELSQLLDQLEDSSNQ
ncbi:MAG: oligoendopeptidase F family protein [bacterium]|nr:oligoendopeptidase F family protein [bacterium]